MNDPTLEEINAILLTALMSECNVEELEEIASVIKILSDNDIMASILQSLRNALVSGFHKKECKLISSSLSIPSHILFNNI